MIHPLFSHSRRSRPEPTRNELAAGRYSALATWRATSSPASHAGGSSRHASTCTRPVAPLAIVRKYC